MSQAGTASSQQWFGHPKGLSTLFFTEMWERFSYYGMRALLVLYMTNAVAGMAMGRETAAAIYGLYTAGVYLSALPGGWIADRLIGPKQAVFVGGIIIAAGHFSMAVPGQVTFFAGLVLIVIGTGLLKPNVSAIVGDLYPEGGARRDAGFSVFYMGINLGAFLGPIICGFLAQSEQFKSFLGSVGLTPESSWHWGFAAAGIGMVLGLIQYRFGAGYLAGAGEIKEESQDGKRPWSLLWMASAGIVAVTAAIYFLQKAGTIAVTLQGFVRAMGGFIVGLAVTYFAYHLIFGKWTAREKKRLVVIFLLFVGAALFWSGFEQAGSSMNLFADEKTDLVGPYLTIFLVVLIFGFFAVLFNGIRKDRPTFGTAGMAASILAGVAGVGWSLTSGRDFANPASWLQSVNPLFIIVLAPVFGWLWLALSARNKNPSIPVKFGFGLVLLGIGFVIMRSGAQVFDGGEGMLVSPNWLIATYFLHTCGELCLSPVGLSSVTKLSPPRLVGQMMGIWFMGSALGNLIAGIAAGAPDDVALFGKAAMISVGGGLGFLLLAGVIKSLIGTLKE